MQKQLQNLFPGFIFSRTCPRSAHLALLLFPRALVVYQNSSSPQASAKAVGCFGVRSPRHPPHLPGRSTRPEGTGPGLVFIWIHWKHTSVPIPPLFQPPEKTCPPYTEMRSWTSCPKDFCFCGSTMKAIDYMVLAMASTMAGPDSAQSLPGTTGIQTVASLGTGPEPCSAAHRQRRRQGGLWAFLKCYFVPTPIANHSL